LNEFTYQYKVQTKRNYSTKGFTLLELLVVLMILGLLAGLVGPRVFANISKSEVKVARAQIAALETALENYRVDTGRLPTQEQGLGALDKAPSNEPKWAGPYLKKTIPLDPWGNPYQFRAPGEKAEVEVFSLGKDGKPGGTAEDADIFNR
jgi:general secretion pathway protein G